jgi:GTP-binding protein
VDEADVIVFVVDVREGITAVDKDIAALLRRSGKLLVIAANKVDSSGREGDLAEAFTLGVERVFPVSATHGRGISDLLDELFAILDVRSSERPDAAGEAATSSDPTIPIRLAFVGKPNAGKSSLVNRLLGEERVLVHHEPGTTRDPIDSPFRAGGRDFVLVDTAGMRRRRSVDTLTEAVAAKMARDQLARADVAVLVIDAALGATAEDARLASLIDEEGRAAVIVLNKGDLIRRADLDAGVQAAREVIGFMSWAPTLVTSAATGRGVNDIPAAAERAFAAWSQRVPTSELNRHFEQIVNRRQPPSGPAGRHIRLYFISQPQIRPPTFFVSANDPKSVGQPYRRYLANQLRQIYGFEGSPIRVVIRAHRKKKAASQARS